MLRRMLRALLRPRPPPAPPRAADPRLEADTSLGKTFAVLGERHRTAGARPGRRRRRAAGARDGPRILRRTGRARFNPMPVWLRAADHLVRGEYEVRGDVAQARATLDARVSAPLGALGMATAADTVEEWAGTVLTRRYEGRCDSAEAAAAVVRF